MDVKYQPPTQHTLQTPIWKLFFYKCQVLAVSSSYLSLPDFFYILRQVPSSVQAVATKTPQTGWFINNKCLFLTLLEAGKPKIKALADSMSGENLCLVPQPAISVLCPHTVESRRSKLPCFFLQGRLSHS